MVDRADIRRLVRDHSAEYHQVRSVPWRRAYTLQKAESGGDAWRLTLAMWRDVARLREQTGVTA